LVLFFKKELLSVLSLNEIYMIPATSRPYWYQFFYLGLGMVAYTICRTGFPVGLSAMAKEFQWSAFEVGVLSTIFLLGQALVDIPAGYCVDRFDRKRVIFVGLFGIGLTTVLVTLASGFWSALIFRVLFGMLEGVYNIAQFAVAGSIHPGSRALVNGITQMFFGIGQYSGQTLVGTLLQSHPGFWQLPLYWLGGITMTYAVVSMALFQRRYLRRFETSSTTVRQGFWRTLGLVIRNKAVWKALSIHGCNMIPNWAVQGLGNYIFINERHYAPAFSAMVFGIGFGVGGLLVPLGTFWADRIGRRPVIAVLGLWTAAAFGLVFYVEPPTWIMVVTCVAAAFGTNCLYAMGYTITQDAVASASMSGIGIATGMAGGAGYLLAMLAGPLVGALIPVVGATGALNLIVIGGELLVTVLSLWFLRNALRPEVSRLKAETV
jgi:MFS family permease